MMLEFNRFEVNLLGNAIKFTIDDGGVILRVEKLLGADKTPSLSFGISDSGIGIPEGKLREISSTHLCKPMVERLENLVGLD